MKWVCDTFSEIFSLIYKAVSRVRGEAVINTRIYVSLSIYRWKIGIYRHERLNLIIPQLRLGTFSRLSRTNHQPVYQPQIQITSSLVPNHYFSHCQCSSVKATASLLSTARNFDSSAGNG